jgi:peptide chain release factor 2
MHFNLASLESELEELKKKQQDVNFYNDLETANSVNKKAKSIENKLKQYNDLKNRIEDAGVMIDLTIESNAEDEVSNIKKEIKDLEASVSSLQIVTLLKSKYDANNAILTLHAGAG